MYKVQCISMPLRWLILIGWTFTTHTYYTMSLHRLLKTSLHFHIFGVFYIWIDMADFIDLCILKSASHLCCIVSKGNLCQLISIPLLQGEDSYNELICILCMDFRVFVFISIHKDTSSYSYKVKFSFKGFRILERWKYMKGFHFRPWFHINICAVNN